jgi:rfaE bifunctional protein nucleotidyltransferase chain/domain
MSSDSLKKTTTNLVQSKIYTKESIVKQLAIWRFTGKKMVFTNGCFDIIHRGHVDYLAKAADLGNVLIVGINSDASVKLLKKGITRPLQDEQSRALILSSFSFLSAVIVFDEQTPYELIKFLQPDVLVKGADYDAEETNQQSKKYIVGSDIVKANGGVIKTIEFLEGFSTTAIERKIKGF